MTTVAIRELKNHLSEYVRRVRAGERILISCHGQVVAELGTPRTGESGDPMAELSGLIEIGLADSVIQNDPSIYSQVEPARVPISSRELLDWLRGDR